MKFLFLILFTLPAFAYRPTYESLLKNNNNQDVELTGVKVNLDVLLDSGKMNLDFAAKSGPEGIEVYSLLKNSSGKVILAKKQKIFNMSVRKNNPTYSFIYAWFTNLLLNNSEVVLNYLKGQDIAISANGERLNKDKIALMQRYKKFLSIKRKNPDYSDNLSPLYSSNPEEQKKLMRIFNQQFYAENEKAQLTRREGKTHWLLDKGDFKAVYDFSTRRLVETSLKNERSNIGIKFFNFMQPDGKHEFPGKVMIKNEGTLVEMKLKSYKTLDYSFLQKFNSTISTEEVPDFLRLN